TGFGRGEFVDQPVFPDAVDAAAHQVVHQVVAVGHVMEHLVDQALLVGHGHGLLAVMGGFFRVSPRYRPVSLGIDGLYVLYCHDDTYSTRPGFAMAQSRTGKETNNARTARGRNRPPGPRTLAGGRADRSRDAQPQGPALSLSARAGRGA